VQAAGRAALTSRLTGPRVLLIGVALLTVALDQVSKVLVVERLEGHPSIKLLGGAVSLAASRNSGAAFSFAEGATVVFTGIAVAVAVVIVRSMARLRSTPWALTLGLLLGGALGNLVDRLLRAPGIGRGAVVDFISVPHFATFNVADSAITVGAALALLLSLRGSELDGSRRDASTAE
jgi:signal peptidase II